MDVPPRAEGAPTPSRHSRLIYLETLRGVAALAVMLGHILAAVQLRGQAAAVVLRALGTPLAILTNGRGAVIFFFTLSGYVLTRDAIRSSDLASLSRASLKRWPRLAGPVLLVTIVSSMIWTNGLYFHTDAARITGSMWEKSFAFGSLNLDMLPDMRLGAAIRQGLVTTFLMGEANFDSSVWTMTYEFYGSFAVYLASFLIILVRSRGRGILICILCFSAMSFWDLLYLPFGIGLAMAVVSGATPQVIVPRTVAIALVLGAIYVLGYREGAWCYSWLPTYSPESDAGTVSFALASAMLLVGVSSWTAVRDSLSGRFGATIGALSFPVYLLHVPIILSAGCASFIVANDRWGTNAASAVLAIVTFAITIPAASLLQIIDARWVDLLNRIVNCLTRRSTRVTTKLPASIKDIC